MARADRRCADGALLDLAGRRRNSAAIRAASCWSGDRQEHSSRCASRIRKVPPPYAASSTTTGLSISRTDGAVRRSRIRPTCAAFSRRSSAARRTRSPSTTAMRRPSPGSRKPSAPTLSLYGTRDHIVEARFGRMLDAALRSAGATSVLLELPWSEHSFDAVPNGMGRQIALSYTERFIAWAVKDRLKLQSIAQLSRAKNRGVGSPDEAAALRHRTLSAASPAESIDQILEHRPGIESRDPASGTRRRAPETRLSAARQSSQASLQSTTRVSSSRSHPNRIRQRRRR